MTIRRAPLVFVEHGGSKKHGQPVGLAWTKLARRASEGWRRGWDSVFVAEPKAEAQ